MTRLKPWKDIILQALQGKRKLTNERIYARVARIIDTPELTPNQKAKVRQQLQVAAKHLQTGVWAPPSKKPVPATGKRGRPAIIGPKPKRKRKPRIRGKREYKPKKPPVIQAPDKYDIPAPEAIAAFLEWCVSESYQVTFTDTSTDEVWHAGQRIHGYEFQVPPDSEIKAVLGMILHVCTELQPIYGNQDTSIDIKVDLLEEDTGEKVGEGWFNVAYAGSPLIAAQRAPAIWANQAKADEEKYHAASQGNVTAFAVTIYMRARK